jgi:lipopolysaccharide transport system ATP-binding protein
VGTGFHPELTGRENIYLNGAVLGMTRQEIRRKFAEIVEFAEVERFLDTPVKRYSSGMYMRLAFAVAANLEPEILVVDEVLAVGDIAFQKKCLGKMGEVARQEGRTVLFVSHNMVAIRQLCRQSIWLNSGNIKEQGDSDIVISGYLSAEKKKNEEGWIPTKDHIYRYQKPRGLTFTRIQVLNNQGQPVSSIPFRGELKILLELKVIEPVEGIRIGIAIHSLDGSLITAFHQTDESSNIITNLAVGYYHSVMETYIPLIPNYYMISLVLKPLPGFWNSQHTSWDHVDNALMFAVESPTDEESGVLPSGSIILPKSQWIFKKLE